ncbi:hypothetical protein C8R47DRAFT_1064893 [Mycena vitilis]|nr:hypothetical protein C8R47DRAFT_1064893 [Mycena vitilis]
MRTGWNTRPEVPERAQTCAAGAGNPRRAQPGIEPELNRGSNRETGKHTNTAWTSFKRTPRVWTAAGARCLSPLRTFPPKTSQTGGGSGHHMVIRRSHTTAGTSYGRFQVRYYTHGDVTKGGESGHRHGAPSWAASTCKGSHAPPAGSGNQAGVVGWEGNRRPRTSGRGCLRVPGNDRKACPGPGSPDHQDRNRRPQHWSQSKPDAQRRPGLRRKECRSACARVARHEAHSRCGDETHGYDRSDRSDRREQSAKLLATSNRSGGTARSCFWRSRKDRGERYGPDNSLGGAAMTREVCEYAGTKPEQAKTSGAFRSSDRTLKQSPGAGVEREPVRSIFEDRPYSDKLIRKKPGRGKADQKDQIRVERQAELGRVNKESRGV